MNYVGIDVAKEKLDVHINPENTYFRIDNSSKEIKKLTKQLVKLHPDLIVMESTGNLELSLAYTLSEAGLKVSRVNPRRVRDFAKASKRLAKTDKIDASVIAHFAEVFKPEPENLPDKETLEKMELLRRRSQLIEMRTAEENRALTVFSAEIKENIKKHIEFIDIEIQEIGKELNAWLKSSPELKGKQDLLQSVKSVGPVLSTTLILELPELGQVSNKKISALVGLAPINRDSGKMRGKRTIWGGRKSVRAALYMPTVNAIVHNPVIKKFYERLIANGKLKKVALTACMHKLLIILNSIIKSGKKWDPAYFEKKDSAIKG